MELTQLAAYALEKHRIREERPWADFPGFSVLRDPVSGKWAALLMRGWNEELGEELQLCDIRCGAEVLEEETEDWLSPPHRMKGKDWVGVRLSLAADPEPVFRLLDRALRLRSQRGYILVLDHSPLPARTQYQETSLPPRPAKPEPKPAQKPRQAPTSRPEVSVPSPLRQMRRLTDGISGSMQKTARDFYLQAKFLEEYEDDYPWNGEFRRFFPTYEDMTIPQLRGYFTWRAHARRGDFRPIPVSAAYVYVYELLNGVGAASPEDSLRRLREFEAGFLDPGLGDQRMRSTLRRWMLELGVVSGLPPETVREYADPELLRRDEALAVLRRPNDREDEAVFRALCLLVSDKLAASPAVEKHGERARRLFAEIWRRASAEYRSGGGSLFTLSFGRRRTLRWYPLSNAVYWQRKPPETEGCTLSDQRAYLYRDGLWWETCLQAPVVRRKLPEQLLHEADRQLRLYLGAGRPLKEKPEERWASPYIRAVLEMDRLAELERAKPRVVIDFSGLEQIRRDAVVTRDSLLTEEDLREAEELQPIPDAAAAPPEAEGPEIAALPLDDMQLRLLKTLLRGDSAVPLLREAHMMATVAADSLNEALFEELGDSAVDCDGEEITLVEDYREDILRLLGGNDE